MPSAASVRHRLAILALTATIALAGCVTQNAENTPQANASLVIEEVAQDESGGARITWLEEPRGRLAEYEILRNGAAIATVQAPARQYVDTDVETGETYLYRVRGYYPNGDRGPTTGEEAFTLSWELNLEQERHLSRGFVNFTILDRSPGLQWSDLHVTIRNTPITPSENGLLADDSWTHDDFDDALVDLGETLYVRSTDLVRRNATLAVSLDTGETLWSTRLDARPTMNLTVEQVRNATQGVVTLRVLDLAWTDDGRTVPAPDDASHRWSELGIHVNDTHLRYREGSSRDLTWQHANADDDVIRPGETFTLRHSGLIGPGAHVRLVDDVTGEHAFDLIVR